MSLAALTAACDSLASDARYAKKTRVLAAALKTWATEQETEEHMGTFTYNQEQDPAQTNTINDGDTWLVPHDTDGYYDLWVYSSAAGGWTNATPPQTLVGLFNGVGTSVTINNDGSLHVAGLPSTDPNVAGQLWNDAGTLKVSAG